MRQGLTSGLIERQIADVIVGDDIHAGLVRGGLARARRFFLAFDDERSVRFPIGTFSPDPTTFKVYCYRLTAFSAPSHSKSIAWILSNIRIAEEPVRRTLWSGDDEGHSHLPRSRNPRDHSTPMKLRTPRRHILETPV